MPLDALDTRDSECGKNAKKGSCCSLSYDGNNGHQNPAEARKQRPQSVADITTCTICTLPSWAAEPAVVAPIVGSMANSIAGQMAATVDMVCAETQAMLLAALDVVLAVTP